MSELRFLAQTSPRTEQGNSFVSPPRNGGRVSQKADDVYYHDPRLVSNRRFTDTGHVPTLSSINTNTTSGPRVPDQPPPDYITSAAIHSEQFERNRLLQKKQKEYEKILQQKEEFQARMQMIENECLRGEKELAQMMQDNMDMSLGNGHQSEPTTPPEHGDASSAGFPTFLSRPNRYSTSSLITPQGFFDSVNGLSVAGSGSSNGALSSPQPNLPSAATAATTAAQQSRLFAIEDSLRSLQLASRNSDDDDKMEAVRQDPTSRRSTNHLNRYSMPVTKSRSGLYDIDQTNTARFLFGDEDNSPEQQFMSQTTSTDENFPTLVRNEQISVNNNNTMSAASSASTSEIGTTKSRPTSIRHSLDLKHFQESMATLSNLSSEGTSTLISTPSAHVMATPPKLQSSFSANDVPTVKNPASSQMYNSNANNHAQQHLHNHNASIGRIPLGVTRHTRELSGDNTATQNIRDPAAAYGSFGSALQGATPSFGGGGGGGGGQGGQGGAPPNTPTVAHHNNNNSNVPAHVNIPGNFIYPTGHGFNPNGPNYNMQMIAMTMGNMNLGSGQLPPQHYGGFGTPSNMYNSPHSAQPSQPLRDSQARVIQVRRQQDNEQMSKYNNLPLTAVSGQIYELCKDQHGCRYLQRKLEERDPTQVHMIWLETNQHVVELMTDPFGNYLCQKLLEFCNEEDRTKMIEIAAKDMVHIALNQHGTRALQKMIEFVTTPAQIRIIQDALENRVVDLIQDLNGNHVIQKCLNKLSTTDSDFIFQAVGNRCIEVGTHRHGCCVLQRCIDHAQGNQKGWLVRRINDDAHMLVKDPFGNYVVQYIIDLNEPSFTEPLVARLAGQFKKLSCHKFGSNVIEKCLRCAPPASKDAIVHELLSDMQETLCDSFGNYVIQTALDYTAYPYKARLIEAIRPHLSSVRNTPFGRRIQQKIQSFDSTSPNTSGQQTPADATQGQIPVQALNHNPSVLASSGLENASTYSSSPSDAVVALPQQQQQQQQPPPPPQSQLQSQLHSQLQAQLQSQLQSQSQSQLLSPSQSQSQSHPQPKYEHRIPRSGQPLHQQQHMTPPPRPQPRIQPTESMEGAQFGGYRHPVQLVPGQNEDESSWL